MKAMSLPAWIAECIRQLRATAFLSQDQVAELAREWGLDWTSATVAAIETGKRQISLEELVLLPWLANDISPHSAIADPQNSRAYELPSIVGGSSLPFIRLTPSLTISARGLAGILSGEASSWGLYRASFSGQTSKQAQRISAKRDAETKAARKLGVDPERVVATATRLWGRTLTEERERILAGELGSSPTPRRLQARRGHVTRALLRELEQAMKARSRAS